MSKFLLEQLEEKFEEMESKETLIEEEEIEEANVTGNLDGGAKNISNVGVKLLLLLVVT